MLKIIISGANGRMGRAAADVCANDPETSAVAGFDVFAADGMAFPVFANYNEFTGAADVLIDFSSPAAIDSGLLEFCITRGIPAVLCTTGYSERQLAAIEEASKSIAVFRSANMSVGVNLLLDILKGAARLLGPDYDVEIVETHHRMKADAPSGTALMLADAVRSARPDLVNTYDRSECRGAREQSELGISSVRGGTVPGEHTVIFAGRDEVLEFHHTVYSREVFAVGAVKAAKLIAAANAPGIYSKLN